MAVEFALGTSAAAVLPQDEAFEMLNADGTINENRKGTFVFVNSEAAFQLLCDQASAIPSLAIPRK
jgi:hypothetical protein